jgi:hypothetical protein
MEVRAPTAQCMDLLKMVERQHQFDCRSGARMTAQQRGQLKVTITILAE